MAVKIRLSRLGRRHRPFFRIHVVESRVPRDGKILEKLGHYDPLEKNPEKQVVVNLERAEFWLGRGAIPSDTVSQILLKKGITTKYEQEKAARRDRAKVIARKEGKLFTKAEKVAADKAAEAAAKEAQEKAKAEAEAAKKAEEEAKAEAEAAKKAEEEAKAQAEAAKKAEEEAKAESAAEEAAEPQEPKQQ